MSESNNEQSVGAQAAFGAFAASAAGAETEQPEMRSVAVSRTPQLILPPTGFGLSKPPPLGISRPVSLSSRGPSKSDSLKVKQTWTGVTAPSAWEVCGNDLEPVPMDFPLERTHRTIEGVDASVVAKRISDALRTHSIEAKFDTKPPKAKCKTNDLVSFRIRLYSSGENGRPVIVEVQRRSGSASSFMRSCRAILAAAEGNTVSAEEPSTRKRMLPSMKPIGQMKCLQMASLPPLSVQSASDDEISKAVAMVRSDRKDSNSLGLESFASLTDPVKTSFAVAVAVSKCVVLGDDKYDVRDDIRSFTDRDMFEEEAEDEEGIRNHAERVRHLALTVFANGLSVCARDGCLKSAVDEQVWFKDNFMSQMVDELKLCDSSACCALQASRCIASLLESSASARRILLSFGLQRALEDALEFGKNYNDLLAEECSRCLKLLDV